MSRAISLLVVLPVLFLAAQPDPVAPDPQSPRPIAAKDSLFMEELTWMEIRDAMRGGKETVIVATGGIEQNGPYLATGKHNIILRGTTEAIARKLKTALIASIVPFVPEGDIDPPSLHMKYPGTVSLTEETFQSLLRDICSCMRTHGFKNIILIGDSGGNQDGMRAVAKQLNEKWHGDRSKVYYIPEYYDFQSISDWLRPQGIVETPEGLHDDFVITALMMAVDPDSVRTKERIAANQFRINGIELSPMERTIEWGRKMIDFRADATVKAIHAALSR